MRRNVAILGILLTVVILISGSAVAPWHFVAWVQEDHTTNPDYIDGAPNGDDASLGEYIPPADPVLGWILLDLGSGNEMGPGQDFTVFADNPVNETYDVGVSPDTSPAHTQYVGSGWDTENLTFQTPGEPFNGEWRYIFIQGTSGDLTFMDPIYGPEIDAVGWWEP